jgi:ribosomal peptide maturation radical SAM protein 1
MEANVNSTCDVLLVWMPWGALKFPSIQIGILGAILEREQVAVGARTFSLDWMELLHRHELSTEVYRAVSHEYRHVGLGDWIFSTPPYRSNSLESDLEYRALLMEEGGGDNALFEQALRMRSLVPSFLEACLEEILASGARVVGFSVLFSQTVACLALARLLKERAPHVKIVFGGAQCDGTMGSALFKANPWLDVVVRGEAEHLVVPLMRELVAGTSITPAPGVCFRQGGEEVIVPQGPPPHTLDDIPPPNYDEYFARLEGMSFRREISRDVTLFFESARGCWWGDKHHCTFCGLNGTSMKFRSKSAPRVLDDILELARRYQTLRFQSVDNIIEMSYFEDLLPKIRDMGLDITLFFETKANLRKEQILLLREAGVHTIQPGIESLSTPILKSMDKGVTAEQNIRLLKWCMELGVTPEWNVITGMPGEDPEEYAKMAELVPSLVHLHPPNNTRLGLDRFSPHHQRPEEYGLRITGPSRYYGMVHPISDRSMLDDLAYQFEYEYADGRVPETYAAPLTKALTAWRENFSRTRNSLTYRRGPGYLLIEDGRSVAGDVDDIRYTLERDEAEIYLACDAGATPEQVAARLAKTGKDAPTPDEIGEFLDELVRRRLVYREGRRYLSLAVAADPRHVEAEVDRARVKRAESKGAIRHLQVV